MNVFQYASAVEQNWKLNLESMTDFRPSFTFYSDFAIAEFCETYMRDKNAVRKTYNQVVKSYGTDIKAMTEIVMVLNHKIWAFYNKVDSRYMGISNERAESFETLYTELYQKAVAAVEKKFGKDEEAMSYYYRVTD